MPPFGCPQLLKVSLRTPSTDTNTMPADLHRRARHRKSEEQRACGDEKRQKHAMFDNDGDAHSRLQHWNLTVKDGALSAAAEGLRAAGEAEIPPMQDGRIPVILATNLRRILS
ncbi:hypothetical protein J2Z31_002742 [Sinorhizobium kostiense]|uniref:Uncharacterized protein n=2 Tax=Sinorhizobium TaxID=28105 RepID=A0ABS4R018_9HYPH|nr:hypothetical protein [Sinorhizobium kostiense]MBP2236228.1 hypothetical protein [Sinorhizobium kostiense]